MNTKRFIAILLLASFLTLPSVVFGLDIYDSTKTLPGSRFNVGAGRSAITTWIKNMVDTAGGWFYSFFMAAAVITIITAGYLFLTAGGSPDKVIKARNVLIWGLVGITVVLLTNTFIRLIMEFLDI